MTAYTQQERIGNLGYFGLKKESVRGTAVIPNDFIPLYDETLTTVGNFVDQKPAFGTKFATYKTLQGQRSHTGDATVLFEPNTAGKLVDMLLTQGSPTGSDPYTHPFSLSNTVKPNSYTVDISTGNVVKRFFGVEASKITPNMNNNELQLKISMSALGSFQGREIASVTGTVSPFTVTLKTDYDPSPTTGLVVADLLRFKAADGTITDATVASVVDGVSFTTTTDVSALVSGDELWLRPATVSFTLLPTFLWSNTQFCFGADAATALSAGQLRVEQSSTWEVDHNFENNNGADRSGGFDPAALVRTEGDAMLTVKKFFDTPESVIAFNNMSKSACVVRHFAYSGGKTYEFRMTFNHLVTDDPAPQVKSGSVNYATLKYHVDYDDTDAQAWGVTVISALATI